ncbi:MAG TPA: bacillithiol biosynthesis cysteine-adding enzyme BshC [Cyclobacteriaceae bacterium]|nr:bacillithiol biosynthesis cysteine-adding enzyme BshC [Cyclobacteriaceae bacterium]
MRLTKVPFDKTKSFSDFFLDYIQQKEQLKPFYERFPSPDSFGDQLMEKKKNYPLSHRKVLVETLTEQYKGLTISDSVSGNLELLKSENTFTIVTGHQLNICTGPLYFIYKIVTVINACKDLKKKYPDFNFIPVYWMASEDHDYEEIKSFRLFGKKYTWNTQQNGAVGRFSTEGLPELVSTLPQSGNIFKEAYKKNKKLSEAVRFYVNALFKDDGLIVIDGDSRPLKSLFTEIIKDDVFNHTAKKLVDDTNSKLEALGYKVQVHCREINFFYLDENLRSRIEKKDDYEVLDSDIYFEDASITKAIEGSPEKFSPNVILRPLYQEIVLPNLAYVGGPAEMVYWLQLKSVFDHYKILFPILLPRNFGLILENHVSKKLQKTGLDITDFFEGKNFLFNHWIVKNSNHNLSVHEEMELIRQVFEKLKQRAENIDVTLVPFVGAESKRFQNSLERVEQKMLRAEKRKQEDKLRQIEAVKDHLFPNGALQERVDNFLNFSSSDPLFIRNLVDALDPFDFQFNVLTYDS